MGRGLHSKQFPGTFKQPCVYVGGTQATRNHSHFNQVKSTRILAPQRRKKKQIFPENKKRYPVSVDLKFGTNGNAHTMMKLDSLYGSLKPALEDVPPERLESQMWHETNENMV